MATGRREASRAQCSVKYSECMPTICENAYLLCRLLIIATASLASAMFASFNPTTSMPTDSWHELSKALGNQGPSLEQDCRLAQ